MTLSESGKRSSTEDLDVATYVTEVAVSTVQAHHEELISIMEGMDRAAIMVNFGGIQNRPTLESTLRRVIAGIQKKEKPAIGEHIDTYLNMNHTIEL